MKNYSTYLLPTYLLLGCFLSWWFLFEQEDMFFKAKQTSKLLSGPNAHIENGVLVLSSLDEKARFAYTLDGSNPNRNGQPYYKGVSLNNHYKVDDKMRYRTSRRYKAPITWEMPIEAKVIRYSQQLEFMGFSSPGILTHIESMRDLDFKIVSLAFPEEKMFDEIKGKMMLGKKFWNRDRTALSDPWWNWKANYKQRGYNSGIQGAMEVLNSKGESLYSENVRIRLHGNASRAFAQKSFRIEPDTYFGNDSLLDVFKLNEGKALTSFLLRNSGNDWGRLMFADAFMQSCASLLNLPTQGSEPVHVLLNGTYWGIYNARTRFDESALQKFSNEDGRLAIIGLDSELREGKKKDLEDYLGLKKIIHDKSISDQEKKEALYGKVDIDNFMNYIIAETFFGNTDWNPNNVKCFRFGNNDPWKWAIYDLDYGMAYVGNEAYRQDPFSKLNQSENVTSLLFRFLMGYPEFSKRFKQRAKQVLKLHFNAQSLLAELDVWKERYQKDIQYQVHRWQKPSSVSNWESYVKDSQLFLEKRPTVYLQYLKKL